MTDGANTSVSSFPTIKTYGCVVVDGDSLVQRCVRSNRCWSVHSITAPVSHRAQTSVRGRIFSFAIFPRWAWFAVGDAVVLSLWAVGSTRARSQVFASPGRAVKAFLALNGHTRFQAVETSRAWITYKGVRVVGHLVDRAGFLFGGTVRTKVTHLTVILWRFSYRLARRTIVSKNQQQFVQSKYTSKAKYVKYLLAKNCLSKVDFNLKSSRENCRGLEIVFLDNYL